MATQLNVNSDLTEAIALGHEMEFNKQFGISSAINGLYYKKMMESTIQLPEIEDNYDKLKFEIKRFSRLPIEGIDYDDYRNSGTYRNQYIK